MSDSSAPALGVLIALLFSVGLYVWASAALAAVFGKLGEPGWKAWVPVYNSFVLFRLGGVSPLWAIALYVPLISVVGFVFSIFAIHSISKQFGKGAGFTVLGVLLTPIWSSILGWGRADVERADGGGQSDAAAPASVASVSPFGIASGDAVPARIRFGEQQAAPAQPMQPAAPPIPAAPIPAAPAPVAAAEPATPATVAPATAVAETVQEAPTAPPVFSYTPAVIAAPAPAAPPAPIEMPEELSVRVEQPAGAPARAATPLIDSVPDFTSSAAPAAAAVAGASASVVLEEQAAEAPEPQPVDDDDMDATVIAGRRNKAWVFETEAGQRVPLSSELVLLGRNPAPLADHPDAQLITVRDAGRTVSKTHASVQLRGAAWVITDLNSTNGVYVLDAEGAEVELEPGVETNIADRFVLGELSARIFQEE